MLEPRNPPPWIGTPRRRIVQMRHAEVDYFDEDGKPFKPQTVPLNAEGRLQAQHAARELAGTPFDRAVCSGLLRSVETATVVAGHREVVVEHRAELREIEPGRLADLEATCPGTIEKAFLGALACDLTPESRFLGGESFGAAPRQACLAVLSGTARRPPLAALADRRARRRQPRDPERNLRHEPVVPGNAGAGCMLHQPG